MAALSEVSPTSDLESLNMPVTLTGQIILNTTDQSGMNSDAFKNPLDLPLRIHELKWAMINQAPTSVFQNSRLAGNAIEASISFKDQKITNAPTPLYNLGHTTDPVSELPAMPSIVFGQGTIQLPVAFGVWKLDEPFYLASGEGIDIALKHRGTTANPIQVSIAISGTTVQKIPARRMLPYIAPYIVSPIDLNPTATIIVQQSTERDLANSLGVDLDVRRIIGRLTVYIGGTDGSGNPYVTIDPISLHGIRDSLIFMSMRSSRGIPVAGDALGVPFGSVFPAPFHCIEVRHRLRPGGYYLVKVCEPPTALMAEAFNYQAHASISLVGYRELA